jgi:diguanylate cyclase (GGDEF)-like protein
MPQSVHPKLQALQNAILEMVARGDALAMVAEELCLRVEALAPGIVCSILRVDLERRLRPLPAPSLPQHYSDALEGLTIGPMVGSCGRAAFTGEPVEVTDIATDPTWLKYRDLALPLGFRACWSSPIKARDGRVIGAFAFYYREARSPSELERHVVDACLSLCAIALEHDEVRARNHQLAYHDTLTGLRNRVGFDAMIAERIAAEAPRFGLLLLDIDHLKTVNDTLGYGIGDALIREIARRLAAAAGEDSVCRLGADEFAVFVDRCDGAADLRAAAMRVIDAVAPAFASGGQTLAPQVTVGGVLYGRDGSDAETLRQNADFALSQAKETRRGGFVRFSSALRTTRIQRMRAMQRVEEALSDGRMLPHYQPIVRLDSGEIVGLEALARMRTTDDRILAAGAFHDAMADPRIAYRLTDCMLAAVAADISRWLAMDIPFQHVGVNVTTGDFQGGDLDARIIRAFGKAGVPLRHVILEVNELVFMGGKDNMVARSVEKLRERGILVALDDFGTGFASLTHLINFPVDIIKIDRSFVDRITTDMPSCIIVEALLDIARRLGMRVVAEGVETAEQAEKLRALGCTLAQGFYFAMPANAARTTKALVDFGQGAPGAGRLPSRAA